jgi:hypothetical protein
MLIYIGLFNDITHISVPNVNLQDASKLGDKLYKEWFLKFTEFEQTRFFKLHT